MRETTQPPPALTRDDVVIRPAAPDDRSQILQIAAQIWDGDDYLPQVLDGWFDDPDGSFNVMTYKNEVIGLGKLSKLGEGEWWLEGLRIDPTYQGRGLARIMHHYMVSQARQLADGVLRFSTEQGNEAVIKLALETGFRISANFKTYTAQSKSSKWVSWWQLSEADFPKLQKSLAKSAYFMDAKQSFEHSWKWYLATESYLKNALHAGKIYGWNPDGQFDTVAGVFVVNSLEPATDTAPSTLELAFGDTKSERRVQLWRDALALAASLGAESLQVRVVDQAKYTNPLIEAGWQLGNVHPVLMGRPLVLTMQAEVLYTEIPALE